MKRKSILLIHILFWFYIINQGLYPLYLGQLDDAYLAGNKYLKDVCMTTILNIVSFYIIYFSFPYLLKFRHKALAVLTGLILLALVTAFRTPVEFLFWKLFGDISDKEMVFKWIYTWNNLRLVIITGIYAILIRFMINWFDSQKLKDELINQQQASELALLRSQINPHFLFNTLNNIYSLVYRKSEEAPAAVMKLSSIMRYMLYDATTDKVPLEKEVEYLKSFIELQKLRNKNPDFVSFEIEGDIEGTSIAPMLLISFVENAFRYGSKKHNPGIVIRLSAARNLIRFEVLNYIKKTTFKPEEHESGIGLVNTRRRLELIYPGKHILSINEDAETYRIYLEIKS